MPPRAKKPAAKTPKPKPAPKRKGKAAEDAPVGILTRTRKEKPKEKPPAKEAAAKPKAAKPKPARKAPVERTRVVFGKEFYEANKDAIKAPLKERGLKWQYLGEGKGRYHKEGVNLFAQFLDDGTHYSLWGEDKATVEALKDSWRGLLGEEAWTRATARGEEAVAEEKKEAESEAMRIWRIGEPQRRPGEPELFYRKRREEWERRRPSADS